MQYITIELSLKTNQKKENISISGIGKVSKDVTVTILRLCSVIKKGGKKYSYNYYKK